MHVDGNVCCGAGGDGKNRCTFVANQTTGADRNLVQSNTAAGHARYGIAQATGNTGNRFVDNTATGNGVADFAIDP